MTQLEPLRSACLALPGATEDMPFGPGVLVFKAGGKLFALVSLEAQPLRMNLKCEPQRALELRARWPGHILPGYHMNKRHWNTLVLDGHLPADLVRECLAHSHALVLRGLPKRTRESLFS